MSSLTSQTLSQARLTPFLNGLSAAQHKLVTIYFNRMAS